MTSLADNPETYEVCRRELKNWGAWSRDDDDKLGYPSTASGFRWYKPGKAFDEPANPRDPIDVLLAHRTEDIITGQIQYENKMAFRLLKARYIGLGLNPTRGSNITEISKAMHTSKPSVERLAACAERMYWDMARKTYVARKRVVA